MGRVRFVFGFVFVFDVGDGVGFGGGFGRPPSNDSACSASLCARARALEN